MSRGAWPEVERPIGESFSSMSSEVLPGGGDAQELTR